MSDERDRGERDGEEEVARVVINDKRRIDPVTGEVRPVAAAAPHSAAGSAAPGTPGAADGPDGSFDPTDVGSMSEQDNLTLLQLDLAERTSDLQRVQAEYLNYRRRVERDKDVARDQAIAGVVTDLLPVLDDIGRAADHGELVGGFKSVADALNAVVAKLGVETFGEPGEPFDPLRHEALMHTYSDEVTQTTSIQVFQPGYRLRDRIIRPARVVVADPTEALPPVAGDESQAPDTTHDPTA